MTSDVRQSSIHVGSLPGRKSKALSIEQGSVIYPVAYFRDDASYERFKAVAKGANRIVWEGEEHDA